MTEVYLLACSTSKQIEGCDTSSFSAFAGKQEDGSCKASEKLMLLGETILRFTKGMYGRDDANGELEVPVLRRSSGVPRWHQCKRTTISEFKHCVEKRSIYQNAV